MASTNTNTPIRHSQSPGGLTIQTTPHNLTPQSVNNINGLRRSPSPSQATHPTSLNSPAVATPTSAVSNLGPGGSLRNRTALGLAPRPSSLVTPRNISGGMRPNSELLSSQAVASAGWNGLGSAGLGPNIGGASPGVGEEGFDRWFADLSNYEATLEEMAAASLDNNFKEELGAIEQWFRVLSEAERTAALYSLLQHSTQMQIRFFITVLQQMSRSDPMTAAMFSPAVGNTMEAQMEAKLASLKASGLSPSIKSPSSPAPRVYSNASFLSPESAKDADSGSLLAAQRSKLKGNRVSAPSPLWSQHTPSSSLGNSHLESVAERVSSPNSAIGRPKSMEYSGSAAVTNSPLFSKSSRLSEHHEIDENSQTDMQNAAQPANSATYPGGSWASMVNTPMVSLFDAKSTSTNAAPTIDGAAQKLASWGSSVMGQNRVVLDDARKFRRASRGTDVPQSPSVAAGSSFNPPMSATLPSTYDQNSFGPLKSAVLPSLSSNWPQSARLPSTTDMSTGFPSGGEFGLGMMSMMPAQMQMANFNALNNGNNIGQMGMFAPSSNALVNAQAQMIALNMMNQQLIAQQQQLSGGPRSARGFGTPTSAKRSPMRANTGANRQDQPVTENVLQDIPNWLRTLRLHKYTPNFEGSNWRDMVMMDDAALEAKGVAALGARRKMLKTFEEVRAQMGIPDPDNKKTAENASKDQTVDELEETKE